MVSIRSGTRLETSFFSTPKYTYIVLHWLLHLSLFLKKINPHDYTLKMTHFSANIKVIRITHQKDLDSHKVTYIYIIYVYIYIHSKHATESFNLCSKVRRQVKLSILAMSLPKIALLGSAEYISVTFFFWSFGRYSCLHYLCFVYISHISKLYLFLF